MVSRDYTKEVGLQTTEKSVPKPVAVIVFLLLAAGGWYVVRSYASTAHEPVPPAQTVPAPSHS